MTQRGKPADLSVLMETSQIASGHRKNLRDSEARLNFALEVSSTGAWDLDLWDHTAHRSLQHDRIFGYQSLLPSWTYEMFLDMCCRKIGKPWTISSDRPLIRRVIGVSSAGFAAATGKSVGFGPLAAIAPTRAVSHGVWRELSRTSRIARRQKRRSGRAKPSTGHSSSRRRTLWRMLDLQGRVVFASERAVELHGALHPDELIGSQATDFVVESGRDKFRASIGRLIEEGVHRNVEYTLLRKDGTTFDAEISSAVISDAAGKPEAFMAVYRDISERKRAEELMRQTLDQLATIYDGMIEGLLITDIETKRFVRVNASFCRMLGYSEEELLAASIKDIHPAEEVPNDLRRFQAAAEGRVSINEDRPVLRKDGSIFYADITGHRIFYDERPCLLALFRDVTERRQAEEKLKARTAGTSPHGAGQRP